MEKIQDITLMDIVSIEGKEGIFRILKVGNSNLIVEALNSTKNKMVIDGKKQISILNEIAIYDQSKEGKRGLNDVFQLIAKHCNEKKCDVAPSSPKELTTFFDTIFPDYDREKVYPSNLKKIIKWYNLLFEFYPHLIKIKKLNKDNDEIKKDEIKNISEEDKTNSKKDNQAIKNSTQKSIKE